MTKHAEYSLGFTHLMLFPLQIIVGLYDGVIVVKNFFFF